LATFIFTTKRGDRRTPAADVDDHLLQSIGSSNYCRGGFWLAIQHGLVDKEITGQGTYRGRQEVKPVIRVAVNSAKNSKATMSVALRVRFINGADGTRTRDLLNASQALCQLSYSPNTKSTNNRKRPLRNMSMSAKVDEIRSRDYRRVSSDLIDG
jgi:hypothetical protein